MHEAQQNFVRKVRRRYRAAFTGRILEIGSLDVNGSVRGLFAGCKEYIGVDVGEGPGVDVVSYGHEFNDPIGFDCVISCECFEHNPYWVETFSNMVRLCRSGGIVIMTCATTGRPEHGTAQSKPEDSPLTVTKGWDYYRNLTEHDFRRNCQDSLRKLTKKRFRVNRDACDLYFVGMKIPEDFSPGVMSFVKSIMTGDEQLVPSYST